MDTQRLDLPSNSCHNKPAAYLISAATSKDMLDQPKVAALTKIIKARAGGKPVKVKLAFPHQIPKHTHRIVSYYANAPLGRIDIQFKGMTAILSAEYLEPIVDCVDPEHVVE